MNKLLFRASSIGSIMACPEKNTLADPAKKFIEKTASQIILDWRENLDMNPIEKGRVCEDDSIDLYNLVNDTFYMKNIGRLESDYITGECDIIDLDNSLVIDIKSAYSKKTFPMFLTPSKLYEWQLRAYMHLWNVDNAELAYCLVTTPDDLMGREPKHWHVVGDADPKFRVATAKLKRDNQKEMQMLCKAHLGKEYLIECLDKKGFKF